MYLSGAVRPGLLGLRPDLGVMLTPQMGNRPDLSVTPWAADTGCFAAPEKYETGAYLHWLEGMARYLPTNLFATAPDVVGDAAATWERSKDVLPLIRWLGYRAALVAQDGLETEGDHLRAGAHRILWSAFDALFVGGSTAWKLSEPAYELVREARRRSLWTHAGRVNSAARLRACAVAGYDSADGTYLAFGPDTNTPKLLGWLDGLRVQARMVL